MLEAVFVSLLVVSVVAVGAFAGLVVLRLIRH